MNNLIGKIVIAIENDESMRPNRFKKGDIGIIINYSKYYIKSNDKNMIVMVKWKHVAVPESNTPHLADSYLDKLKIIDTEMSKILYGE